MLPPRHASVSEVFPLRRLWVCALIAAAAAAGVPAQVEHPPNLALPVVESGVTLAVPTPEQLAWQQLEVGMFIHLAPQTWQDSETDDLSTPASAINPEKLDTDQWVRVARSMGAGYIVFVAKHEGGFCWWPTRTTDHSVRSSPWREGKGDVLADLARSCAAAGVRLGVYLSPQDKKHRVGVGGRAADPADQAAYESIFREQLTEVLTGYGEMVEVWFDGSLVFDVGDILKAHAPRAMVFQGPQATIRWVGNEDGICPEDAWNAVRSGVKKWGDYTAAESDAGGDRWLPIECDARIRSTWFWKTNNLGTLKSVDRLLDMYERSVGRGNVLLLNNTPDRSGLIPEPDARRSAEFGAAVRARYETSAAETSGAGRELVAQPSAPVRADRVVIQEGVERGERVRSYVVEGLTEGDAWIPLGEGKAIGAKRIVRFDPVNLRAVRLRILEGVGEVSIRRFSVHACPVGSTR